MRSRWFLVLFACLVWYTQSAYGRFPLFASGGGGGGGISLTDVTVAGLHSVSFTAPASANTVLGTIVVSATGGAFSGSLSLSGTDAASFHIVGSALETQASGTLCASPPCNYSFNIVVTQGGAAGSPLTQAFTGTGAAAGGGGGPFIPAYCALPGGGSTDGSVLVAGQSGTLTAAAATWNFGSSTDGLYYTQGNGSFTGVIGVTEMAIANGGQLYAWNRINWTKWNGSGWLNTADGGLPAVMQNCAPPAVSGTAILAPTLAQASTAGQLVSIRAQNISGGNEAAGYVTFGQVFKPGAVAVADSMTAVIGGTPRHMQMDVRATHLDGSVRHAILTYQVPAISTSGTSDAMITKGSATPPVGVPTAAALAASSYDVNLTFSGAAGADTASCKSILAAANGAGRTVTRLNGAAVAEYDTMYGGTVYSGKLVVRCVIRAYADGTTQTDVMLDNTWFGTGGKTDLTYSVAFTQDGFTSGTISQYIYSFWHHQVNSAGTITPNMQYDVPYLTATGAVPQFDLSYGVNSDDISLRQSGSWNPAWNPGPMKTNQVATAMATAGGRDDIAELPNWHAEWLVSQNATARVTMFGNSDVAGTIPWHYRDENTNQFPDCVTTFPNWLIDNGSPTPANGWPNYASANDPWTLDYNHESELNYLPYLITGSQFDLKNLIDEAGYDVCKIPFRGPSGEFLRLGTGTEIRGFAWGLRQVLRTAYLAPDADGLKTYFKNILDASINFIYSTYITGGQNNAFGDIKGQIYPMDGGAFSQTIPYENDFVAFEIEELKRLNVTANTQTKGAALLDFLTYVVDGFLHPDVMDPQSFTSYWTYDSHFLNGTHTPITTWADYYQEGIGNWAVGINGFPPPGDTSPSSNRVFASEMIKWGNETTGGYNITSRAAIAHKITGNSTLLNDFQAYCYSTAHMQHDMYVEFIDLRRGFIGANVAGFAGWPGFNIAPTMPSGRPLFADHQQVDVSNAASVTVTAISGSDNLIGVVGSGAATLNGGTTGVDLFCGDAGTTTMNAGSANAYMFGGWGATTFVDGTGMNYMKGWSNVSYPNFGTTPAANTHQFGPTTGSGTTEIANFRHGTDKFKVKSNLNGNGITTAAGVIAACSISGGNTNCNLGSGNKTVTFDGVTTLSAGDVIIF